MKIYWSGKRKNIIGEKVRAFRKEKGMTQTALAEKIGISRVGLSKAINGNTTIQTLEKIAEALGVEVAELFTPTKPTYVCPHCGKALHIEIK